MKPMETATKKVALFNDTRSDSHFGCTLVIQQTQALLRSKGIEVAWFWPVGRDWHDSIDWKAEELSLDGIVVNGEGTIHHSGDRPRARWLAQLGPFVVQRTTLPVYLINATIDSIDAQTARDLQAYDGIFVRDSRSRDILRSFGVASEVVPDVSMLADLPPSRHDTPRRGVCATDSVLPAVTSSLLTASKQRGWTYRPMRFAGKKGRLKLRRCLTDGPWFILNRIWPGELPGRFATFIARHELVVTGRFHTVAYCLLTQTPFVAVESNTPKISALMQDVFGCCERMVAHEDIDALDVARFARWTPKEAADIDRFLLQSRARAGSMIEDIRAAIDRRARRPASLKAAS